MTRQSSHPGSVGHAYRVNWQAYRGGYPSTPAIPACRDGHLPGRASPADRGRCPAQCRGRQNRRIRDPRTDYFREVPPKADANICAGWRKGNLCIGWYFNEIQLLPRFPPLPSQLPAKTGPLPPSHLFPPFLQLTCRQYLKPKTHDHEYPKYG